MKRDNDVWNSEENDSKPQTARYKDINIPNENVFLFKEAIVLVSIVCLSLINSLSSYLQAKSSDEMYVYYVSAYYRISSSFAPVVGVMFAALLMEVTGRKHIYRYVYALSVLTSILVVCSKNPTFMSVIILFRRVVVGASSVMSATAVCEYSTPKHRFTWLIFNNAASTIINRLLFALKLDSNFLLYTLTIIQILLGLICLGMTRAWPESPYWLANRRKLEPSRDAFLWLRGKESSEELASVLQARRRPGPAKLFWISLLVAGAIMLVSSFSYLQITLSSIFYFHFSDTKHESQVYIHLFGTTVISCTLAVVSYFVRRKLLFIVVSCVSFALCYAEAIFIYVTYGTDIDNLLYYSLHLASDIIQTSGPAAFGEILSIEITPHKYNTCISCVCYIVMFLSMAILLPLSLYIIDGLLHPSASLALTTTFTLLAALLYFFFAPETKDKTLLEIQRSYTPDENDSNPEQNRSIMLNVI